MPIPDAVALMFKLAIKSRNRWPDQQELALPARPRVTGA